MTVESILSIVVYTFQRQPVDLKSSSFNIESIQGPQAIPSSVI